MSTEAVRAFWEAYREGQGSKADREEYSSWGFGNSPRMADELGALVLAGTKTATSSLYWAYEIDQEHIPAVGEFSVITDGQNQPICIIQTTAVHILPFDEVKPEFAYLEGEGERTLEYWRKVHWNFFSEECARIGKEPSLSMPVVCERFRRVYPMPPEINTMK